MTMRTHQDHQRAIAWIGIAALSVAALGCGDGSGDPSSGSSAGTGG
jgi:hypothetical protein